MSNFQRNPSFQSFSRNCLAIIMMISPTMKAMMHVCAVVFFLLSRFVCGYGIRSPKMDHRLPISASMPAVPLAGAANIPTSEMAALQDLFIATNGADWHWSGARSHWNFSGNPQPCETPAWQGLTCTVLNDQYRIQDISLTAYNLVGTLPPSMGNFSLLTSLNLADNFISGPIPESVYSCSQLTRLSLNINLLTGSISPHIGNCSSLEIVELFSNGLTSSIPESIYSLPRLAYLQLDVNKLTGTLSDSVGSTSLHSLYLNGNFMRGTIPQSITSAATLVNLYLGSNNFTGTIPDDIGRLSELAGLALYDCQLNGTLPSSLGSLTKLQFLEVYSNRLTGPLPESLSLLTSTQFILLNNNELNGTVPDSYGELAAVENLDLGFNRLSGTIPASLGRLKNLNQLWLNNNRINGTIPAALCDIDGLVSLQLESNELGGTIPAMANLTTLTTLILNNNNLTGTIPTSLYTLNKLENLQLYSNELIGTISSAIGNMTSLLEFSVSNNFLTGTIPSEVTQLTSELNQFIVYNNLLNGTIPANIGDAAGLIVFDVGQNLMTGTIPDSLWSLTNLTLLLLFSNDFNGTLSERIGDLRQLADLSVYYNHLSGTVPESVYSLHSLVNLALAFNDFHGTISEGLTSLTALQVIELDVCYFNGTMPQDWSRMVNLQFLQLSNNTLSGPIPEGLLSLPRLFNIFLGNNQLTGPLPSTVSSPCLLQEFEAQVNHLTGGLPTALFNCPDMNLLYLYENHLSQSLPANLGNTTAMTELVLETNLLTGSFPASLCRMQLLEVLFVSQNAMVGSVPCQGGYYPSLNSFGLQLNSFTGALPAWSTGTLAEINFSSNLLWGELFPWLGANPIMVLLLAYSNLFSGSIASDIGKYPQLLEIQIYDNMITGVIPQELRTLPILGQFLANGNQLTGGLVGVTNATHQPHLTHFDVSSNQLTGTIPDTLFDFPQLQVFGAAVNCLQGSISESICNCPELTGLVMDGLSTATSCQHRFFPHSSVHKAYYLLEGVTGSIPSCLFAMPALSTLHLSGNGIGGTIPDDVVVSTSLVDLSLSHNSLTGTIPLQLQNRPWANLDLSYNRLKGSLHASFAEQSNSTSLSLEVNHLSGVVPASVRDVSNVDVLDGNMFSCNYRRTNLPSHDENEDIYECGSNSLNAALYVFATLLFVVVMAAIVLKLRTSKFQPTMNWLGTVQANVAFRGYCSALHSIRVYFALATLLAVAVLMPAYIALTHYYSTYSTTYSWVVSAAYLGGLTPAVVLLVLWAVCGVVLVTAGTLWLDRRRSSEVVGPQVSSEAGAEAEVVPKRRALQWLVSALLVSVNALIVTLVNVAYVYVTHNYGAAAVVGMQLFVVVFKLAWNNWVVTAVLEWVNADVFRSQMFRTSAAVLQSQLVLFNNLVAPFIATAFISSNCFYNVISTPSEVTTSFTATNCDIFVYVGDDDSDDVYYCIDYSTADLQTSYTPPFIYGYQCASTFIAAYTDVYVYMFVVVAFVTPLVQLLLNRLRMQRQGSKTEEGSVKLMGRDSFFKANVVTAELMSALGILLTFGGVFPPLAVVILVAVLIQTLRNEVLVGRLLVHFQDEPGAVSALQRECSLLMRLLAGCAWVVVPVASLFYAYLLFDTLGDSVGWRAALWLPFTGLGLVALGAAVYWWLFSRWGPLGSTVAVRASDVPDGNDRL